MLRPAEERQPLTKKQQAVFDFIVERTRADHVSPSLQEIGLQFNIKSLSTVAWYIECLTNKGWLERTGPRAIKLPPDLLGTTTCPHCGLPI